MIKYISIIYLIFLFSFVGCNSSTQVPSDLIRVENIPPSEKNIVVNGPNNLELDLIYIKPGRFIMGRNFSISLWLSSLINWNTQRQYDTPTRKVTITKGFYIGKYQVTVAQYCKFLNSPEVNQPQDYISFNFCSRIVIKDGKYVPKPGTEDCPVNTVPWYGANAYCKWLTKTTRKTFRLPTDAEWEYTARGPGSKYPEPRLTRLEKYPEIWMGTPVYSILDYSPLNITPDGVVGMKSYYGLGEWVSDYFAFKHSRKDKIDPTGPKESSIIFPSQPEHPPFRVLRRTMSTITHRDFGYDAQDGGCYGFRVLMEIDIPKEI